MARALPCVLFLSFLALLPCSLAQIYPSGTFTATPDPGNNGTQVPIFFTGGRLYLQQVNHTFVNATEVQVSVLYRWDAGTYASGFLPVVTMTLQYFIQGLVTVETIRYAATGASACQQNAGLFGPYLCLDGGIMRYWLGTFPFSPAPAVNNHTTQITVSGPGGGFNWGGVTNALTLTCTDNSCNPITVPSIVTARRPKLPFVPEFIKRKAFLNIN